VSQPRRLQLEYSPFRAYMKRNSTD